MSARWAALWAFPPLPSPHQGLTVVLAGPGVSEGRLPQLGQDGLEPPGSGVRQTQSRAQGLPLALSKGHSI